MTWQLEDEIALFEGQFEDNNGEIGEPIWVGDFNLQLDSGPWNVFYGLDVIGGGDSRRDYLDATQGTEEDGIPIDADNCRDFVTYDTPICAKMTATARFYHSAAVTREFQENFRLTVGISNIFNTNAPRVTEISGTSTTVLGRGVLNSQYDLRGRRAFVNLNITY
jgi:iron complex outermembrane receptor protein